MSTTKSPAGALILLAVAMGGGYLLLQPKPTEGEIWNKDHSPYVNLIDKAYAQSDGTTADYKNNILILQKQQGQQLIDVAISRTKSSGAVWDDNIYASNLKSVYNEFFNLHTLSLYQ